MRSKAAKEVSGDSLDKRTVTKYAKRREPSTLKYMRKALWKLMIKAMPREVARFIQSRFEELKISESRYEDLLSEADQCYPEIP
jgi:intergrase/recombinase